MHSQQFDTSINETWLDSTVADHEVDIDGYELIRKNRNRNGGGVAIYIRSSINSKRSRRYDAKRFGDNYR